MLQAMRQRRCIAPGPLGRGGLRLALALGVLVTAGVAFAASPDGRARSAPERGVSAEPAAAADEAPRLSPSIAPQEAAHDDAHPRADAGGAPPRAATRSPLDWFTMLMSALAGLVLFILGVTQLAQGLGELNSERMRGVTARFTSNPAAGVATGAVATTLLESSSVTIIMVIAMVSGGILTFTQSLGVVLGANIGTAVGSQIIALEIERYVPMLMFAGLLLMFVGKSRLRKRLGIVVLGFGLMFYGLEAIDDAMRPLRAHQPFMDAMRELGESPLLGAGIGALFTVIVQSSSAAIAIVITLASSGLISLPAGIALMLGAEIGTCADTLVASVGRGRPALRTGVFHLAFNLLSACVGLALATPFARLVQALSGEASVGRQIANAQMLFNVVGVALALPWLGPIARLLTRAIPDREVEREESPEAVFVR